MTDKASALLVYQDSDTLRDLQHALERQGVRVIQATSRADAKRQLGGINPAPLVFTDAQLPDGTWADILGLAEKALLPVNVIVVARLVDTRFYVEAIEAGAFDFIAPPFNSTDLRYVVRNALDNVIARRTASRHGTRGTEDGLFAEVREPDIHASTR